MSQTSAFSKWVKLPTGCFDDEQSVAAGHAHVMRNNFAHLTDSSTQVRVHWTSATSSWSAVSLVDDDKAIYHQEFPLSWLGSAKPANLLISVRTLGLNAADSSDIERRILIVPAATPVGSGQRPILDERDTTVDGDADTFLGSVIGADHLGELESCWEPIYTVGDPAVTLYLCMLRIEVWQWIDPGTSEDTFAISQVYVREFA